jgi:hypothetical protein
MVLTQIAFERPDVEAAPKVHNDQLPSHPYVIRYPSAGSLHSLPVDVAWAKSSNDRFSELVRALTGQNALRLFAHTHMRGSHGRVQAMNERA